ncbi:hypothetical protein [Novosphingobium colocasiae]|uniref:hypothetical protein n=1 Tax=Novosphingobium colocasiae TaxID=1256513 RepID=UPI0035B010F7
MSDSISIKITLIYGAGAADHLENIQNYWPDRRVVTDTSDMLDGDILVMDDPDGLLWIGGHVILLPGERGAIVQRMSLDDAPHGVIGVEEPEVPEGEEIDGNEGGSAE